MQATLFDLFRRFGGFHYGKVCKVNTNNKPLTKDAILAILKGVVCSDGYMIYQISEEDWYSGEPYDRCIIVCWLLIGD